MRAGAAADATGHDRPKNHEPKVTGCPARRRTPDLGISITSMSVEDRIAMTMQLLQQAAATADMRVTGDLRISEADASTLLGYSGDTLAKKRAIGNGPAAYSRGMNGCRVSYRLADLAAWIEEGREIITGNPD